MKYKNQTIETLVPYENIEAPILDVGGLRITRNAQLDVLHEIRRYTRFGAKRAGRVAFKGIELTLDALDQVMYPQAKIEQ